jgi:hypothetical protein
MAGTSSRLFHFGKYRTWRRANTLRTALFHCCFAKRRRFYFGDTLSPGTAPRYELAVL